ncbi:hypothetical protein FA95DRAFT_1562333, partial [Auriscalpium vulgare]
MSTPTRCNQAEPGNTQSTRDDNPIPRTREELMAHGFSQSAIDEVLTRASPRELGWERVEAEFERVALLIDANHEQVHGEGDQKRSDEVLRGLLSLKAQIKGLDADILELAKKLGKPLPPYYTPL